MAKPKDVNEFFTDPKFSEEAKFLRESFDFLVKEAVEDKKKKSKDEKTWLQKFFDSEKE